MLEILKQYLLNSIPIILALLGIALLAYTFYLTIAPCLSTSQGKKNLIMGCGEGCLWAILFLVIGMSGVGPDFTSNDPFNINIKHK